MSSLFNSIFAVFFGAGLTAYGLVHTVTRFPEPAVFNQFLGDLPTLGTVLLFTLGIVTTVAGFITLIIAIRQVQHRWAQFRTVTPLRSATNRHFDDPNDEREWGSAYR